MVWIALAAVLAALFLLIRILVIKRQLRKITLQIEERTSGNSAQKINISLFDRDLTSLAASINSSLSEQKNLRIEVRRNDQQLKDSIANLSHDLRTPLTSILGYLQLAEEAKCPAEKKSEYLEVVSAKAHLLKKMIDNLYDLSVFELRDLPPKIEKIDLNLLLTEILAGQYALFQNQGIKLFLEQPKTPVFIAADSMMCTRIIQNLLQNAARYAQDETHIQLAADSAHAILSVSNPAPGLSQKDVEHLSERFYTSDQSRSNGHTGLGLYIVKTLLERINGKIICISLENHILKIVIAFPLDP